MIQYFATYQFCFLICLIIRQHHKSNRLHGHHSTNCSYQHICQENQSHQQKNQSNNHPPKNKPESVEANNCRTFLKKEITNMQNLKVIVSLGVIAHNSIINCFGLRLKDFKFSHGKSHKINRALRLQNSYHCSRYNTNTKRLSTSMFEDVFRKIELSL